MVFKSLIDMFKAESNAGETADPEGRTKRAATALMVEAALMDGSLESSERAQIEAILIDHHDLSPTDAATMIDEAIEASSNTTGWHEMTSVIKENLDYDQRVQLINHLWQIADADGELHDFEHNLIRRVSGLLYVDDRARAKARNRT